MRTVRHRAKNEVLKVKFCAELSQLRGVDFESEEDAILTLHFDLGNKDFWTGRGVEDDVSIRFLDDVARERFRRGLVFVVTLEHHKTDWHRLFQETADDEA